MIWIRADANKEIEIQKSKIQTAQEKLAKNNKTETANILKEKGFIFDDVVTNEDELVEGICKQLR